jgi:hypothetical protein
MTKRVQLNSGASAMPRKAAPAVAVAGIAASALHVVLPGA